MKGYVFLDPGGNLQTRSAEYIDNEDPGFFQRNKHLVVLVWKFDTDNEGMMYELMASFQRRQLSARIVQEFCIKVNFDLNAFKTKYKQAPLVFTQPPER